MTSKDDSSLSEEEIDEIVERVVDELEADGAARPRGDEGGSEASEDPEDDGGQDPRERSRTDELPLAQQAQERAERVERRADRLEDRVDSENERLDRLGEQIEAAVERRLERVADTVERSLSGTHPQASPGPGPGPGPGAGPGPERAVYKTQLQKGGRIAVPDAEIEALDLEPGDTLQVTLYEVD